MINNKFDFENTFPEIGNPEHHFNKYPNHPWLKTKDEIESAVLNLFKNTNFVINDDLTVSINNWISITSLNEEGLKEYNGYMPIQIRACKGVFNANNSGLKSIIGTPYLARILLLSNNEIESLVGLSSNIISIVDLAGNFIKDFNGMPKEFNSDTIIIHSNPIVSWDGFTKSKCIKFKEYDGIKNNKLDFLLNTPIEVDEVIVLMKEPDNRIKFNSIKDDGEYPIDMVWLREFQKSVNIDENLNNNILQESKRDRRRKL